MVESIFTFVTMKLIIANETVANNEQGMKAAKNKLNLFFILFLKALCAKYTMVKPEIQRSAIK